MFYSINLREIGDLYKSLIAFLFTIFVRVLILMKISKSSFVSENLCKSPNAPESLNKSPTASEYLYKIPTD